MRAPPKVPAVVRRQIQHNKDVRILKDAVNNLQGQRQYVPERGVEHYYRTLILSDSRVEWDVPGDETDISEWGTPTTSARGVATAILCHISGETTGGQIQICVSTHNTGDASVTMAKTDGSRTINWHLTIRPAVSDDTTTTTTTTYTPYDPTGQNIPGAGEVVTPDTTNPDTDPNPPANTAPNTTDRPSGLFYRNVFKSYDDVTARSLWFVTYPTFAGGQTRIWAVNNASRYDPGGGADFSTRALENPRGIAVGFGETETPNIVTTHHYAVGARSSPALFSVHHRTKAGTNLPTWEELVYTPTRAASNFALNCQPAFLMNETGGLGLTQGEALGFYAFYTYRRLGSDYQRVSYFALNHSNDTIRESRGLSLGFAGSNTAKYVGCVVADGHLYAFQHHGALSSVGWGSNPKQITYKAFNLQTFAEVSARQHTHDLPANITEIGLDAAHMSGHLVAVSVKRGDQGWHWEPINLITGSTAQTSPAPSPVRPQPAAPAAPVVLGATALAGNNRVDVRIGTSNNRNSNQEHTLHPAFYSEPRLANRNYDLVSGAEYRQPGSANVTLPYRVAANAQIVTLRDNRSRTWGLVELRGQEDEDIYSSDGRILGEAGSGRQAYIRISCNQPGSGATLPSGARWVLKLECAAEYTGRTRSPVRTGYLYLYPFVSGSQQLAPGSVTDPSLTIQRPATEGTALFGDWFEEPEHGQVTYTATSSEDGQENPLFGYELDADELSVAVSVPDGTAPDVGGEGWVQVRGESVNVETGLPVAVSVRMSVVVLPAVGGTARSGVELVIPPRGSTHADATDLVEWDVEPATADLFLSDLTLTGDDRPIGLEVVPPGDFEPQRVQASDNEPEFNSASVTATALVELGWTGGHTQQVSVPFTARTNAVQVEVRNNFPASTGRTMNTWIHPYNHTGFLDLAAYHFNLYSSYDLSEVQVGYSYRLTAEADRYFDVRFDLPRRPGFLVVHRHNSANWNGTIPIYVTCIATAPNGDTHQVEKTLFYRSH